MNKTPSKINNLELVSGDTSDDTGSGGVTVSLSPEGRDTRHPDTDLVFGAGGLVVDSNRFNGLTPVLRAWIATEPVGKGRPRFTRAGRTYTPSATSHAESRIQQEISTAWGIQPLEEGPLAVALDVVLIKPKSKPKTRPCYPTGRPDLDNYAKLVLDALNGLVWRDDAQVVQIHVSKRYGPHQGLALTVSRYAEG